MSLRIAVLEDDKSFADLVISWLEQAGYTVAWFSTGHKFLQALHDARYDLLIFDWLLPDMDGLEVMQHLKLMDIQTPVIFLTGRDTESHIVKALEMGADDYIVKPPAQQIFLARVAALLRRHLILRRIDQSFGNLWVSFSNRQFKLGGESGELVSLTVKESELAIYFFQNIGALMSRAHLMQVVWGSSADLDTRTVDVHVSRLRNKLQLTAENGWRLTSVYHQGYRLERVAKDLVSAP